MLRLFLSTKKEGLVGFVGRFLRHVSTKKEELLGVVGGSLRLVSTKKAELLGVVGRFKGLAPLRS